MTTDAKSHNFMKSRPNTGDGPSSSKSRVDISVTKKKSVEVSIKKSPADAKNKPTTDASKMVRKTRGVNLSLTKTRVKKVYSLPGQKFDVPEEREPLRIFYESLSKQIPSSEMAEFWLMEHGMLSPERAKKAYEKKQRKQKQLRTGTPIKAPPLVSIKPESSKRPQQAPKNGEPKAKKRIVDDSDEDDDFVLSHKRRK